jgi:hypothetical protein
MSEMPASTLVPVEYIDPLRLRTEHLVETTIKTGLN